MNDFTKEDLSILFKCVRISEMEFGECKEIDKMKIKLQFMIDNYDAKIIEAWHCEKCGHVQ